MTTADLAKLAVAAGILWAALCICAAGWLGGQAVRSAGSARTRAAAWWASGVASACGWFERANAAGCFDVVFAARRAA